MTLPLTYVPLAECTLLTSGTDGGYDNYVALWWQSQLANQQQGQAGAGQAPGTS